MSLMYWFAACVCLLCQNGNTEVTGWKKQSVAYSVVCKTNKINFVSPMGLVVYEIEWEATEIDHTCCSSVSREWRLIHPFFSAQWFPGGRGFRRKFALCQSLRRSQFPVSAFGKLEATPKMWMPCGLLCPAGSPTICWMLWAVGYCRQDFSWKVSCTSQKMPNRTKTRSCQPTLGNKSGNIRP